MSPRISKRSASEHGDSDPNTLICRERWRSNRQASGAHEAINVVGGTTALAKIMIFTKLVGANRGKYQARLLAERACA